MSVEHEKVIKKLTKDVQDLRIIMVQQNNIIRGLDKEIRRLKHQSVAIKNDIASIRRG